MDLVNALTKVRFSSAKPQRILVQKNPSLLTDLLCMEAAQELKVTAGHWMYYVVAGSAIIRIEGQQLVVPTSQLAFLEKDQKHVVSNMGPGRLICIAISPAD